MDILGKRGKIWGDTETIFSKNNVEIARICIKAGGYCSIHLHEHKYNMFFVESGCLNVTIFRHDSGHVIEDTTTMRDGDSTYVEPGLKHKFHADEDTIAYEIYWTESMVI